MQMSDYLDQKRSEIEQALQMYFEAHFKETSVLNRAIKYSVLNGGKRIRPILCIATAESCKGSKQDALPAALAVELFHCSTLIHDDLPCMDDDDLRRGRPTCHIQFGEANAVLAGDALMIEAFKLLAKEKSAKQAAELAQSAGAEGVIAGQVADLAAEHMTPSKELVDYIHYHKTAILIRAAVRLGALSAHVNQPILDSLTLFAEKIGIAFQIQDDILDETSSSDELGKPAGSDRKQSKMTYPSVYGMEASLRRVKTLTDEAIDQLKLLDLTNNSLEKMAYYLVQRSK
jgi:geranylgeranyl diphosphate synthase type II